MRRMNSKNQLFPKIMAVSSIIALFIPFAVLYIDDITAEEKYELTIGTSFMKRTFLNDIKKIQAKCDSCNDVQHSYIYNVFSLYFVVKNTGNMPIKKNDFIKDLKLTVGQNWEIKYIKPLRSSSLGIHADWNKIKNYSYKLSPLLLNSNDYFWNEMGLKYEGDKQYPKLEDVGLKANARLLNISDVKVKDANSLFPRSFDFEDIFVCVQGYYVYILATLFVLFYSLVLFLLFKIDIIQSISKIKLIFINFSALLCMSAAETVAYVLQVWGNPTMPRLHYISIILFIFFIIMIITLIIKIFLVKDK